MLPLSKDRSATAIHPPMLSVLIPISNHPKETHQLAILFLRRLAPALLNGILDRGMSEGAKEPRAPFRSHFQVLLLRLNYPPGLHPYPLSVQALP